MSSDTINSLVEHAAKQRTDTGMAHATYRTPLRGDLTAADRKQAVLDALKACGLTATTKAVPLPSLVDSETGEVNPKVQARTFTAQRMEVLGLFAEGYSYTEVARMTHRNVETVKSHAGNLYRIFGVKTKVECIIEAVRCGVLPFPTTAPARAKRVRKAAAAPAPEGEG